MNLDELRSRYSRKASGYDRSMACWERVLFRGDREWAASQTAGRVVEVAIGTGRNLPLYPAGTSLIGVDLSEAMLKRAAARAAVGNQRVDLRVGDAQALPLPAASVDTVLITFATCTVPDVGRALAEVHRVLRPGGQLLLVEHGRSTNRQLAGVQRRIEPWALRRGGEHLTRDLQPMVAAAGLAVRDARRHSAGVVLRLRAVRP